MGKLIMWNLITLDGYFDGPKGWDLGWHQSALEGDFFRFANDQLRTADMLLFGRTTYEGMARHWQTATGETAELMNAVPKIVFSRTMDRAEWENTTLIKDDPAAAVRDLKRRLTRNIFVFGSANLSATLIEAGLFDEYRLGLTSIVLGAGRPLFHPSANGLRLNFLDSERLSSGCVVLRYAPG